MNFSYNLFYLLFVLYILVLFDVVEVRFLY